MAESFPYPSPGTPFPQGIPQEPPAQRPWWRSPVLLVLIVAGLVISIGITEGELHFNGDEMRHGFTGVFFRDLLVDMPWQQPFRYAFEYYAKYPALGVPHWPPFFYLVEAVFYLVFGISAVTSRLAILAFSLMGVYFWYRIAERQGSPYRAALAAFLFPLVPYILLYERATMLEIPMLALCFGTIYFWLRFLETEHSAHLWAVAAFASAAMLTSQKAAFLAFFLGLHFLMERRFRLLLRWQVWLAVAASLAAVLPWYLLTVRTVALTYQRAAGRGFGHTASYDHLLYYLYHLPRQLSGELQSDLRLALGLVLVTLAGAGVVWALLFAARRYRFLLLWIFATYVFFSLIQEKDLRHTMIWIPPLIYMALLAIEALCAHRRWALVASGALALLYFANALQFDRPKVKGLDELAKYVVQQPESDLVYYQGFLNGDFIFHVRKYDPEKRRMVAREKQVVATRIVEQFGREEILTTPDEVLDFFRTWGIRYAVVEAKDHMEGLEPVHAALDSGAFERVRTFTVWSNIADVNGERIYVYRYRGELQRSPDPVVIPMLTLREHIRVKLSQLTGEPWPQRQ